MSLPESCNVISLLPKAFLDKMAPGEGESKE